MPCGAAATGEVRSEMPVSSVEGVFLHPRACTCTRRLIPVDRLECGQMIVLVEPIYGCRRWEVVSKFGGDYWLRAR